MPRLIPTHGDRIVLISPEGIEYPGTIAERESELGNANIEFSYRIKTALNHPDLWRNWKIRLEDEDCSFGDFQTFLTTDRLDDEKNVLLRTLAIAENKVGKIEQAKEKISP